MRSHAPIAHRRVSVSHITQPTDGAPASSQTLILFSAQHVRTQHAECAKAEGIPLTMFTACDTLTTLILEAAGVDMLPADDSLDSVILDHSPTLPVILEGIGCTTTAVTRSTSRTMIVVDLPFGTYEDMVERVFTPATCLMKAGTHTVKLEGGRSCAHIIMGFVLAGVPVCTHLGYTPRFKDTLNKPRMQGRRTGADALRRGVEAVQKTGAFTVAFKMAPVSIATELTQSLSIPTIGIGAGPNTDGRMSVRPDIAGHSDRTLSFVRKFGRLGPAPREAVSDYVKAVCERPFPRPDNCKND